jgi:hypothetical protein
MNQLERQITDTTFVKLADTAGSLGRSARSISRGARRAVGRTRRAVSSHAGDLSGAATDSGVDGVSRMVKGEASNRALEAGGGYLSTLGGTDVTSAGSLGAKALGRRLRSSGSSIAPASRGVGAAPPASTIPTNAPVSAGSRAASIRSMRNLRKANSATRAAINPSARMARAAHSASTSRHSANLIKNFQKVNTPGKVALRGAGSGILRAMPLLGVGVDVALDGPQAALKENFSFRAPKSGSGLEAAARAGGDLLTAASAFGNPAALPVAIPAAARTADRAAHVFHAGNKARGRIAVDAARQGNTGALRRMASNAPVNSMIM